MAVTLCISRDAERNHNPKRLSELKALAESLGLKTWMEHVGISADLMITGPITSLETVLSRIARYSSFPYLVTTEAGDLDNQETEQYQRMTERFRRLLDAITTPTE